MKWDSIKSRLLVMTILCVLGMILMTVSQQYFGRKLIKLNQHHQVLQQLKQDLLQLRRHEKDFLLRKDPQYLSQFDLQYAEFVLALQKLDKVAHQYQLPASLVSNIAEHSEQYVVVFRQLVDLMSEAGLTVNDGLRGKLQQINKQLRLQREIGGRQSATQIDELNFSILEYLLTESADALKVFNHVMTSLTSASELPKSFQQQLTDYQRVMMALETLHNTIGNSENNGLRGLYRHQAHLVEDGFTEIEQALQPLLIESREQANWYSSMIALLTSVALILLLIKSFATFHRSFANFVLFFYRCKRQYQRIDPKQLGFSEFRSLATLANEMIESRRQIEQKLAQYESAANRGDAQSSTN